MKDFTTIHVPGRKWYAIETKHTYDKRVIQSLQKKKIEVYCPLISTKKQYWDGTVSVQTEPLFPSIAFVKISSNEIDAVRHTEGVVHFLYWLDSFAIISDKDISIITEFLNKFEKVRVERIPLSSLMANDNELSTSYPEKTTIKMLSSIGYKIISTDIIKQRQTVAI